MLLGRSPHLCGLFDAMTARSAAARPSAAAALVHPCFEQLAAASAAEGGGGGRAKEERTCCLCLCDAPHVHAVGGGLECAAGRHFACDECLSHHVHHASVDDLRERARREGRVRCPMAPLPSFTAALHVATALHARVVDRRRTGATRTRTSPTRSWRDTSRTTRSTSTSRAAGSSSSSGWRPRRRSDCGRCPFPTVSAVRSQPPLSHSACRTTVSQGGPA